MTPTPDGINVSPKNAQEIGQRDELKNYTKKELMMLAEAKSEETPRSLKAKKSKEKVEELELESENYRIPSGVGKTLEERDFMGWSIEDTKKDPVALYINARTHIKSNINNPAVLKKELDSHGAAVIEYQDDGNIPKYLVGQQFFNRAAITFLRLKLPTYKQLKKIEGGLKNHELFLKNNFQKDGKLIFPGKYYSKVVTIDEDGPFGLYLWLAEGESAMIGACENAMGLGPTNPDFFYSIRLLKK